MECVSVILHTTTTHSNKCIGLSRGVYKKIKRVDIMKTSTLIVRKRVLIVYIDNVYDQSRDSIV